MIFIYFTHSSQALADSFIRDAERDPQSGDRGIHGDPPRSLQLLPSGGEVLRSLEEAEIDPAEEG